MVFGWQLLRGGGPGLTRFAFPMDHRPNHGVFPWQSSGGFAHKGGTIYMWLLSG